MLMPKALTAENGAKALLMGEFKEVVERICPHCEDEGEACPDCNGLGEWTEDVYVSWTTIKAIYAMAVENLGCPLGDAPGNGDVLRAIIAGWREEAKTRDEITDGLSHYVAKFLRQVADEVEKKCLKGLE